jgi:hypothetical protein
VLTIAFVMTGILVLAGLVVLYVAFPHRGESVPAVPWVGDAMKKGLSALPTIDETEEVFLKR